MHGAQNWFCKRKHTAVSPPSLNDLVRVSTQTTAGAEMANWPPRSNEGVSLHMGSCDQQCGRAEWLEVKSDHSLGKRESQDPRRDSIVPSYTNMLNLATTLVYHTRFSFSPPSILLTPRETATSVHICPVNKLHVVLFPIWHPLCALYTSGVSLVCMFTTCTNKNFCAQNRQSIQSSIYSHCKVCQLNSVFSLPPAPQNRIPTSNIRGLLYHVCLHHQ